MRLRIHLTAQWQDAATPCAWALLDDDGNLREAGHSTLAAMPQADDVQVILATDRVLSTAVTLPKLKRSKLETALPFALEEHLLDDVQDTHVTAGACLPDGRTMLHAVAKDWLGRFLAAAAAAKLRVRRVLPEHCLLPLREGEWSVAWDGRGGFLALPGQGGLALDHGDDLQPPVALQLRLQDHPPAALRIYTLADEVGRPAWRSVPPVLFEQQRFDWRKTALPADAPNLLWGKFAPPPRIDALWPRLRPALMAGLLLCGLEAALSNIEWALLAHEQRQLQGRMEEMFRETFGAEAALVNAPLQMQRSVAHLRHAAGVEDDADFLPLLERFAAATAGLPGRTINTLRYESGKLDIDMRLAGAEAFEPLRQRLAEAGLGMQIMDRQSSGSLLSLQLRISAGGGQ